MPNNLIDAGTDESLRLLGKGGMGEVYRSNLSGKPIAIKRILPEYSVEPLLVQQFEYEAKIHTQLKHPNIVEVYQFNHQVPTYELVMEYIEGVNLNTVLSHYKRKGSRLKKSTAIYITLEILKGLIYAHEEWNVIHRDISPQNVMVGKDGAVKLIDFGVAQGAGADPISKMDLVTGKLAYASPEQLGGRTVDARSDIYSTAVVLYELLSGERLKRGETRAIGHLRSDRGLLSILTKALLVDPKHRFPTARLFYNELKRYCKKASISPNSSELKKVLPTIQRAQQNQTKELVPTLNGLEQGIISLLASDLEITSREAS